MCYSCGSSLCKRRVSLHYVIDWCAGGMMAHGGFDMRCHVINGVSYHRDHTPGLLPVKSIPRKAIDRSADIKEITDDVEFKNTQKVNYLDETTSICRKSCNV